jgi:hypothetical protein
VTVGGPEELEAAFERVVKGKADAVVLQTRVPIKRMAELALMRRQQRSSAPLPT